MKIETERLERGDRVMATREVHTTQGFHIPKGAEGTVAEDRGANIVVFFDDGAGPPRRRTTGGRLTCLTASP
jgi:hypothetical protein